MPLSAKGREREAPLNVSKWIREADYAWEVKVEEKKKENLEHAAVHV